MLPFRFTISLNYRKQLQQQLQMAQKLGRLGQIKRLLAVLAVADGQSSEAAAAVLQLTVETVTSAVRTVLLYGPSGLRPKKSPGRPPKLTKTQQRELAELIEQGPSAAGFSGGCWRSPMIQQLIAERYGVSYSVYYLAELLKHLGFSYQKARFVSDHLDELKRNQWRQRTWPQLLRLARQQNALLLFGDEASFPQWGTLSYTWARRAQQPEVRTCGKRKSYKVLGLIDYFTGRLFYASQTGRLNSECYQAFLQQVLAATTQHIILIQDGAPYHTSKAMQTFFAAHQDRLTVFQLPSYSPDYNPIEKLWKKIKQQETHMHYFPTFEALTAKVEQALLKFQNNQTEVLSLCSLPTELARVA